MSVRHAEAAKRRGEKRSSDIERRIRAAIELISSEMSANNGIYPNNGGALSLNEISRRADIHSTTLFTKPHAALKEELKSWLAQQKTDHVVGRTNIRMRLEDKAEEWKGRYLSLERAHIKTELDLHQSEAERAKLLKTIEALKLELSTLRDKSQSSLGSNVTKLRRDS